MYLRSWALLLCAVMPALAGVDLNDKVPNSGLTYGRLLRLVCADLKVDKDDSSQASASKMVKLRQLDSGEEGGGWDGESFHLKNARLVNIHISGKPQVLLLFSVTGGDQPGNVLGLFELGPSPRLLDAVEAPSVPDMCEECGLGDIDSTFPVSADRDGFAFLNSHSNSSQGYALYSVFNVYKGKLQRIWDGTALSCQCGPGSSFEERFSATSAPDPAGPYRQVTLKVTLKMLPGARTRGYTRVYTATYHWDAAQQQFTTSSKELEQLGAFNEKRY